jgi:hypothetical protein
MSEDAVLNLICEELRVRHAAHTLLLYGSRADGSADDASDYDVAAFAPVDASFRIARYESGRFLDLFVYPESVLNLPAVEHLRFRGSKVLRQRDQQAEAFLRRLESLYEAGPEVLSLDEIEARRVWAHKMLSRISRGDPEGDYRRVWLLQALLEDYFQTRGLWYEGPKRALQWLARSDERTFEAFRIALRPGATLAAIATLVFRVAGEQDA